MSKFITFEGIDGCGKTTQIKKVSKYLADNGIKNVTLREPGNTDFAEKIREILLDSKNTITAKAELLLFEAARADLVENVIKPKLAEGITVICDRFFDSTIAYQGYGRGLDTKFIEELNAFATDSIKPDITFYLKISLNDSKERAKRRISDRMELSGDRFFDNVLSGFNFIAAENPKRIKVIDATRDIEIVHQEILKNVLKLLK